MSTLKYRTVMSAQNPIPSTFIGNIHDYTYHRSDSSTTPTPKPFILLIDDKPAEMPERTKNLFSGFRFILEDTILLLKTMDDKYMVIRKAGKNYEFFSAQGKYIFEEIIDINCSGDGLAKVYAFCVKEYGGSYFKKNYWAQRYIKKIHLHAIGWSFTGGLSGLDPEPAVIEKPQTKRWVAPIEISELFGPFPQWNEKYDYRFAHDPWWVALCTDDKYRILSGDHHGNLSWVTVEDGSRIETFKRFMPIVSKANYFYFLTTNNKEYILHAFEEYGSLDNSLKEARKGTNNKRVDPYYQRSHGFDANDTYLFPGKKYELWSHKKSKGVIPGEFTQQRNVGW